MSVSGLVLCLLEMFGNEPGVIPLSGVTVDGDTMLCLKKFASLYHMVKDIKKKKN